MGKSAKRGAANSADGSTANQQGEGNDFFPPRPDLRPTIYAYKVADADFKGLLKVGYTTRSAEERVAEQFPTKGPKGKKLYEIVFCESAMRPDGSSFSDHDVHRALKNRGHKSEGGEWFRCKPSEVKAALISVRDRTENIENRSLDFAMRPEQQEAVKATMAYFKSADRANGAPKFLWNAKMRFGKTFAAYQLAKRMGLKKILVLTFKPAAQSAWEADIVNHVDFEGWQFITRTSSLTWEAADKRRPVVCFGSFQDYLGTNELDGIKAKNEWVHATNWDLVIFDEYHFGAWREKAKNLFEAPEDEELVSFDAEGYSADEKNNAINETWLPITTEHYLYLSGTPFRALNSGEFIEDQIYNWTYPDEQRAKALWAGPGENPYSPLPRLVMMTYRVPESIREIASKGEYDEFDLNEFFAAQGRGNEASFKHEEYVQKWLNLIRGAYLGTATDDLKLGQGKAEMPFSNTLLLSILSHTLWFLPDVASVFAMKNLLGQRQNSFFHDYRVIACAGAAAGVGVNALPPLHREMGDPLETKTITLTCGKLTAGVTVPPWSGIFMLRNLSSPETYFQAAFRVQNPWEIRGEHGKKQIIKHECYVFDFALNRALRQIAEYSCKLDIKEGNPETKVADFIKFLPVIAYDGASMKRISAEDVLDIATAGTSATLLAKRWESALLVNVDNMTLGRLMANEAAMNALMGIEDFRSLNLKDDIAFIIAQSEKIKGMRTTDDASSKEKKKELSEAEKEFKSKRKMIQEKLIKLATRIPIFMYLTDYREHCLKDVVKELEPALFRRVTGLGIEDFDLLVSLGVFNAGEMNDAIYKFKRYEDSSLEYTGINRHEGEPVGGFDTVLARKEYEKLFASQQRTLGRG